MVSKKRDGTVEAYSMLVEKAREYQKNYPEAYEGEDEAGVITFTEIFKMGSFRILEEHCISIEGRDD